MVQVAAVSKQEDADILVTALQKKQYPVFIANAAPAIRSFTSRLAPSLTRKMLTPCAIAWPRMVITRL